VYPREEYQAHEPSSTMPLPMVPATPVGTEEGHTAMHIWTEFKNTVLPWMLAGGVVAFLIMEHRRTTEALLQANQRLANAVEQQGKALDGVRGLLASQGYTLPPLAVKQ
jgi:hypothetical protein